MNLKNILKKIWLLLQTEFHLKKSENTTTSSPKNRKLPLPKASFHIPRPKQLKYLSRLLSPKEKQIIKILLILIALSLIFLAIRFTITHLQTVPRSDGTYSEAVIGAPQFINPVLGVTSDIDKDLTYLVYSGLLKYNKNQKLVPDLITDYTISEDQKTYTFYLKKDVLWHDDEPLTADDVLFTIKTIQNPDYKSPLFVSFKGIEIEKIDASTLKFQLEEPFAPFLSILTVGILPRHLWETISPEQFNLALYNTKPIGTGPYKFKSLTKDKTGAIKIYSLEANQDYFRRPPYIKNLNFKFYSNFSEAILALKNKSIDGLSYLPKEFKKEIETNQNLNLIPLRLPQYTAIFFNQNNNPFLKSKNVRQSLTYGLDKQEIISRALDRSGEIIHGPILPGSIGYNPDIRQYEYDSDKAEQLLKNSGFIKITPEEYQELKNVTAGDATSTENILEELGLKEKQEFYLQKGRKTMSSSNGREILEINLTTVDQSENKKTAEIIKTAWQTIGVKVNLKILSSTEIKQIIKSRNYQALLYGIITGFDPDPYPFWHSSQNQDPGLNLAVFSNKEVDYVLEDARKTTDEQIRKDKYIHFQNILVEELPAIFLYNPTYTYVLDQKIKGFEITRIAQPSDRFLNIEDWYIKTKKVLKW